MVDFRPTQLGAIARCALGFGPLLREAMRNRLLASGPPTACRRPAGENDSLITMHRPKQLRILGLLAMLAFGLHGAQALAHDHESGIEADCVICHIPQLNALAVGPSQIDSRLVDPVGAVTGDTPPAARPASQTSPTSRGPPPKA